MGAPEHVLELERRIEVAHEQLEKLPMGGIKVRTIVVMLDGLKCPQSYSPNMVGFIPHHRVSQLCGN